MLTDPEIAYLQAVLKRSREERKTWFGLRKTSAAEAAECVLVAYFPRLLNEIVAARVTPIKGSGE